MNEVHINCRVCKGRGDIEFERGMRVKPCQMCRATGRDAYAERAALEAECERLREKLYAAIETCATYKQQWMDARAELAAIKGQEPVGWRDPAHNWSSCSAATKKEYPKSTYSFTEPLYTLPAFPEGGEV